MFLPVKLENNVTRFVTPGSNDLVSQSPIVDCQNRPTGIFKINNTWHTNYGEIHVSEIPVELIWSHTDKTPIQFNTPTLFHDNINLEKGNEITTLRQFIYKTQRVENTLNRLINYTSSLSLAPDMVYKTVSGLSNGIESTIEDVENTASKFIHESQHEFTENLNTLVKGPVQLILNTLIILLIIIVLLYIAYFLITRRKRHTIAHPNTGLGAALLSLAQKKSSNSGKDRVRFLRNLGSATVYTSIDNPEINCIRSNMKRTPLMKATINGTIDTICLLDTGASFTLIDSKIVSKLKGIKIYPTNVRPIAANGQTFELKGAVFITIQAGDIKETLLALIQDDCSSDLILGTNLFNGFKCILFHWEKSYIRFKQHKIPIHGIQYFPLADKEMITIPETMLIAPRAITRLQVPVTEQYLKVNTVIFEPLPLSIQNIHLPYIISDLKDGNITIEIFNASDTYQILFQDIKLGKVSAYDTSINTISEKKMTPTKEWIQEHVNIASQATKEQRQALLNILYKYPNLYATEDKDTGKTDLITHGIDTGEAKPIRKFPFRTAPEGKGNYKTRNTGYARKQRHTSKQITLVDKCCACSKKRRKT